MNLQRPLYAKLFFLGYCLIIAASLQAQHPDSSERDTSYIRSYANLITTRTYISQKYTLFTVNAPRPAKSLAYFPNTTLNFGIGATYRSFTLNLAYGFGFLNPESGKGKTRYLDLQSHIYGVKWRFDFFGQLYKGYYLTPKGLGSPTNFSYYLRPDLRVRDFGINGYYIFNHRRFSYRAAFVQNEWQRRSAGSFLAGGGVGYGQVLADSGFAPPALLNAYPQGQVSRVRHLEFGPGIGYAYSLVLGKHWFATGSATVSFDMAFNREREKDRYYNTISFMPNTLLRLGIGYNSPVWNVNFSWVSNQTNIRGIYDTWSYRINTGNYRFNVVKRFEPGPKLKRWLRKTVDRRQ